MVALDYGHTTDVIEIVMNLHSYLINFNVEILKSFREDLQASLEIIRECEVDDDECIRCIDLVDTAIKIKEKSPVGDPNKIVLRLSPEN